VLAQVFNPKLVGSYHNGVIRHAQLVNVWSAFKDKGFAQLAPKLVRLMEVFEVCFPLEDPEDESDNYSSEDEDLQQQTQIIITDEDKEIMALASSSPTKKPRQEKATRQQQQQQQPKTFFERSSIITSLLPEKPQGAEQITSKEERRKWENLNKLWPVDSPHNRKIQVERIITFNVVPKEMVSRLLVRLHEYIQARIVWRCHVLILKDDTQAFVKVDLANNQVVVTLRGPYRQDCCDLMNYLVQQIELTSVNYPGVQWKQMIRSPHDNDTLLELDEVLADANMSEDFRTLCCPQSKLPIKAESLLAAAGLIDQVKRKIEKRWWDFGIVKDNLTNDQMESLLIVDNGKIVDQEFFSKLELLMHSFGGHSDHIRRAYAIDNPSLRMAFEKAQENIEQKQRDSPSLFKVDDWKQMQQKQLREQMLWHLNMKIGLFRKIWNDGSEIFAVPMIQGTDEDSAWKICKNGFGMVGRKDAGYYGKGIYFTSDLGWAKQYSKACEDGSGVYLVAMTIPGNVNYL